MLTSLRQCISLLLIVTFHAEINAASNAAHNESLAYSEWGSSSVGNLEAERDMLRKKIDVIDEKIKQLLEVSKKHRNNDTDENNRTVAGPAISNFGTKYSPAISTVISEPRIKNQNPAVVALVLAGHADVHEPKFAGTWKKRIVDPLAKYGHSSHAFICCHAYVKNSRVGSEKWWRAMLGGNVSSVTADSGNLEAAVFPGQFSRLDACFDMVLAKEKSELNVTFTHFLRGRPDAIWLYSPGFLESSRFMLSSELRQNNGPFEADEYVYIRARSLLYAKTQSVQYDALSSPDHICLEPNVGILKQTPNITRDKRMNMQREFMLQEAVPFCGAVDDQVALVPRKLAAAYFTMTHFEKTGVFKHPDNFTDIGSRDAIAQTYGSNAWNYNQINVCSHWTGDPPITLEEYYAKAHNRTEGVMRKYSTDSSRCYAEGCLTGRLVTRLVPFKIAPIPYLIAKMYDYARRRNLLPPKGSKERRFRKC